MIKVKIIKIPSNMVYFCANKTCKHSSQYFEHYEGLYGNDYRFFKGSPCVIIYFELSDIYYYCVDCIDEVYKNLKPILDRKLWVFHDS